MSPQSMLMIAAIERARWYLNVDAPLYSRVDKDGGLTADTVSEIARLYNVRRTLGAAEGLADVARHLNKAFQNCPNDLLRRAEMCLRSANHLKEQLQLHHTPCSAVTKLTWFLRPAGWTVYDRFALQAVRAGGNAGNSKMYNFYARLNEHEFGDAAQQVEDILSGTAWSRIGGARVLDAFLMLKGGFPFMLKHDAARQGFLDALPDNSGKDLSEVADQIAIGLADCRFINFVAEE